ncbi:MAG: arylesterase [Flavobacterium sp.]|nr:MAG: arylesterase [Flavobacterium sp.]
MLRKRIIGMFVFTACCFGCGNTENDKKTAQNENKTATQTKELKNILFFGTSLTAGYGLDPSEAYPALLQNKIDSLKLPYKVINGGLSGETSAAGKSRIDWLLKQPVDVFVLELGANDGLRGLPVNETEKNLQFIIDAVKAKHPKAKMMLAGMQMPPNMGAKYADDFKNMFPALAEKNKMVLIPFLLDGVGGVPKLNQPDGIHPTAEGDKILAKTVWKYLEGLL